MMTPKRSRDTLQHNKWISVNLLYYTTVDPVLWCVLSELYQNILYSKSELTFLLHIKQLLSIFFINKSEKD